MPKTALVKCLGYFLIFSTVLGLGVFLWHTDFEQLKHSVFAVGWDFAWLVFVSGIGYLFGSLAWSYCYMSRPSNLWKLFQIRLIGETVSLVNPSSFVGGDLTKVWILNKHVPHSNHGKATALSRVILMLTQLLLFIVLGVYFVWISPDRSSALVMFIFLSLVLIVAIISFVIALINFPSLYTWLPNKIYQKLSPFLNESQQLITRHLSKPQRLVKAVIFSWLHWLAGGIEIYFLFRFMGIEIGIGEALLLDSGIVVIKSLLGFIPAQIGVEEYATKILMLVIGVTSNAIWFAVAILRRCRQLVWILIGAVFYFSLSRKEMSFNAKEYGNTIHQS